jgi:hypothetical protein
MLVNEIKRQIKSNAAGAKIKNEKSAAFGKLLETDAGSDVTAVNNGHISPPSVLWSFPDQEQVAYDYGSNLLDDLNSLYKQLILGKGEDLSPTLTKLKQLTSKELPIAESPELNNIIKEIRIRAAIELAKIA